MSGQNLSISNTGPSTAQAQGPDLDMSKAQSLGVGAQSQNIPNPQNVGSSSSGPDLDMSQATAVGQKPVEAAVSANGDKSSEPGFMDYVKGFVDPTEIGNKVKGVIHGVESTVGGLAHAASMLPSGVIGGAGIPGESELGDYLQGKSSNTGATPEDKAAQNIGYGGETLAEFLGGEGALTTSKGLADTSKIMAVLEKSPKLIQALKIGASALKQGAVQGAQTFVRTGDLGEAAKSGAEMAATGGMLGVAGEGIGAVARSVGKGAKSAGELAEAANTAPDKQTIAQNIQGQLHNAEDNLHTNYENNINDYQSRLQGSTVEPTEAPIAEKAGQILEVPDPEDHSYARQAAEARGQKLDKPVRELLENIRDGKKPLTAEDQQNADEANRIQDARPPIVDAQGIAIPREPIEPEAADADPLDAKAVIQTRQEIRALAAQYEPGDVNARALKRLLWDQSTQSSAFDDTFEQLARQSNDPTVADEYNALRNDYRNKIAKYDDPVIKNLMLGKVDDAAKAFIGTKSASGLPTSGKTNFNLSNLKELIGQDGFDQFRNEVFGGMLKDSVSEGSFNPSKFLGTLNRLSEGTKQDFFNLQAPKNTPWVNTQIQQLGKDAKTAANLQRLVRAGVIGAVAKAGVMFPQYAAGAGIATVLGYVMSHEGSGGGLAAGRDLIDHIANNPKTWALLRAGSKSAEAGGVLNKVGQGTGTVIKGVVNQSQPGAQAPDQTMNAVQGALSRNPKKGKKLTALDLASSPATTDGNTAAEASQTISNLPPQLQAATSTIPVQITKGNPDDMEGNRGSGQTVASSVTQGAGNNAIEVNNSKAANDPATMAHELTHVWQNNLPPSVQAKIPADAEDMSAFNISDADKLRKQGKTLADLPREKQATIIQKYVEDPKKNANLKPWVDDMQTTGLSTTLPTGPNDTKLNTTPRAPGRPAASVAGAYPELDKKKKK
jgi:hypothetical protein